MGIEHLRAICFSILEQLNSYFYRSPCLLIFMKRLHFAFYPLLGKGAGVRIEEAYQKGGPSGVTLKLVTPDQDVVLKTTFLTTSAEDITPLGQTSSKLSPTISHQVLPKDKVGFYQHGGKIREKAKVKGNSLNTPNSLWLFAIRKFSTTSSSLTNTRDVPVHGHKKESDPLS